MNILLTLQEPKGDKVSSEEEHGAYVKAINEKGRGIMYKKRQVLMVSNLIRDVTRESNSHLM